MMHIPIEAQVECADGHCGKSVALTVDPVRRQVTHVIVDDKTTQRLVPMDQVEATASDSIRLRCTKDQLAEMPSFVVERFVPVEPGLGEEAYRYYALPLVTGLEPAPAVPAPPAVVADEQVPLGELAVHRGMPVEASDGRVGKVGELVVDPKSGEITHFVLQEGHLWGKNEVTLPLSAIDTASGDAVYLKLDKAAIEQLPAIPVKRHHWYADPELELVVKVYDKPGKAEEALKFVHDLHNQRTLKIRNAAILTRDEEGAVTVRDTRDIDPKKGRLLGAITGGLIGLVGGPAGVVVGALAGAGTGAVAGKRIDFGFSDKFLSKLQEHLQPGSEALVVLVEHEFVVPLSESLARDEGTIVQQTLTDKLVEELMIGAS
ncbi:MAG: DUF1269 domain-containing protein [Anaerolineae bacterium]|jgi:uncharacterized membrane protein/sporulation protein YlmC with PRC-barrel domain